MAQVVDVDSRKRQKLAEAKIENAFEITPDDNNNLPHPTIALYVGTSGDIKLTLVGGDTITLKNIGAGAWHPISAIKVFDEDTTADEIVGAYSCF